MGNHKITDVRASVRPSVRPCVRTASELQNGWTDFSDSGVIASRIILGMRTSFQNVKIPIFAQITAKKTLKILSFFDIFV